MSQVVGEGLHHLPDRRAKLSDPCAEVHISDTVALHPKRLSDRTNSLASSADSSVVTLYSDRLGREPIRG